MKIFLYLLILTACTAKQEEVKESTAVTAPCDEKKEEPQEIKLQGGDTGCKVGEEPKVP